MDALDKLVLISERPSEEFFEATMRLVDRVREKYWYHRIKLIETNFDPCNDEPVIACCELPTSEAANQGRPWWVKTGKTLSDWSYVIGDIEDVRADTGGAAILRYHEQQWTAFRESPKKRFCYLDAEHEKAGLTWGERVEFWGKVQRDVFFPKLVRLSNVRLNSDGSGMFLDGVDHERYKFGDELSEEEHHPAEYDVEGERRRLEFALKEAINYRADRCFNILHSVGDNCYYNGLTRRIMSNQLCPWSQVKIGSDEYHRLLDRMVQIALGHSDPDPMFGYVSYT